jgi:hypothetical protein
MMKLQMIEVEALTWFLDLESVNSQLDSGKIAMKRKNLKKRANMLPRMSKQKKWHMMLGKMAQLTKTNQLIGIEMKCHSRSGIHMMLFWNETHEWCFGAKWVEPEKHD